MFDRKRLCRFCRDEMGTVTVETVLILPVLVWCYVGTFVFFDAFQTDARNIKATYTIADILSREVNEPITPEYLDSLFLLQANLIDRSEPLRLRVSVVRYGAADDTYRVVWSQTRGSGSAQTDAGLAQIREEHLPVMFDGEVGIIVEAANHYTPLFDVGLDALEFEEFMILRPRFAPTLCWSDSNSGPWTLTNQIC